MARKVYVPVRYPGWFYGPDGEKAIFNREEDVPDGWKDHPWLKARGTNVSVFDVEDDFPGTDAELSARLTELNIPHNPRWFRAKLLQLLKE